MCYTIPAKELPNWLVWCEKSPQLERQGEKSPLKSGGEPMPQSNSHSNSHSHSHAHSAPRPHQTIFVLFILAIVLTIAAIFTEVFDLDEFCGFNDVFNDLDDDFELEKSDLNGNAYGLCEVSPVFDTFGAAGDTSQYIYYIFDLCSIGVGLTGFGDLEYYFLGVLSAPAVTNGNEIKMRFDRGCTLWRQCTQTQSQTQQQNTAAPAIDSNNKKYTPGIGLCDFNNNMYIYLV